MGAEMMAMIGKRTHFGLIRKGPPLNEEMKPALRLLLSWGWGAIISSGKGFEKSFLEPQKRIEIRLSRIDSLIGRSDQNGRMPEFTGKVK